MALLTRYQRARLLLLTGSVLSLVAFYEIGKLFNIPWFDQHEDSLLQHPHPVTAVALTAITFWVCTAVCTLIVRSVRANGGVFCAAVGMTALSLRGGPMGDVLRPPLHRQFMRC